MTAETFSFQAEVSRLLHIVTHSLYSEKEIFLRELVSNASDACEKLRWLAIAQPDLLEGDSAFAIEVRADKAAGTLTVSDNGVGMSREDMIANLGTIARSGSSAFLEQLTDRKSGDLSVIGQFGVGFYSAFMVADTVDVTSRKAGEAEAHVWRSNGSGDFTIDSAERAGHGTTVVLKIAEAQKEFLDTSRLRRIIETYSDHIAFPIRLVDAAEAEKEPETVNRASALWTRSRSDITEQQYAEFYKHVAGAWDEPWATLHARVEGKVEYTLLLFVPTEKPFDLFNPERRHHLKLYVKRVFITDEAEGLVPGWLRFLRGVVDSEDLPLNVSREMLQNEPLLRHMRGQIVKRVLTELEKKATDDAAGFATFWENFGAVVKEGLYEDHENAPRLLKLARFRSTAGDDLTGLEDYVGRMKPGQDAIYYLTAEDAGTAAKSPHLEGFRAKGVEVLLLTDPVDDFWLSVRSDFDGKPLRSVTRGGADLSKIEGGEDTPADTPQDGDMAVLVAAMKQALDGQVKDVRRSDRLAESPVCLVADDNDMDMRLERMLKAHKQVGAASKRILEINPKHPLIRRLVERVATTKVDETIEEAARLLYDQALIVEGETPADPAAFSRRMADFMVKGLV
ncbi:MAG: molecular chaperone HtpG [Pseudomonadota bacterium]|nr:molecular chaperone HtpG [Pseudomonadota bacterium]